MKVQSEVVTEGVIEGEMKAVVQQEEEPLKQEEVPMKESMKVPVNDPRKN